jgi:hypothetical protein
MRRGLWSRRQRQQQSATHAHPVPRWRFWSMPGSGMDRAARSRMWPRSRGRQGVASQIVDAR